MKTTETKPHLFREAKLDVRGRLFCHSMPGREEPVAETLQELRSLAVDRIVSLAPQTTSCAYLAPLTEGARWLHTSFPIPDYGVPEDEAGFLALAREIASELQDGKRVLVHCGAGHGRTGLFAISVGMACGLSLLEASGRVATAGSRPDTGEQREFLRALNRKLS